MSHLSPAEREEIRAMGRDADTAEAQLAMLMGPRAATRVHRAATLGDGIHPWPEAVEAHRQAADAARRQGRVSSFVPASGAATRLCKALLSAWRGLPLGDKDQAVVRSVLDGATRLAMWPELAAAGAREGDDASILRAMFDSLQIHALPKGLVPFHGHPDGARTAFAEHLREAAALGRSDDNQVRAHFTISPAHRARFEAELAAQRAQLDVALDVSFSVQDPRTDTLAAALEGGPFRGDDGQLLFRPGGHGALIHNLASWGGDLVVVKNIDNVLPDAGRGFVVEVRSVLLGMLAGLQAQMAEVLTVIEAGDAPSEALVAPLRGLLGLDPRLRGGALRERLCRPLRVVGMVRNEGQPGGGPFWADSPDGVTLQIVEGAQIASEEASQAAVVAGATHFNPVELALAVRDPLGRPLDLLAFTDPSAVIMTEKSKDGRALKALEHPGLWNGAMARWNTVFVEVPSGIFQPVKTMADLLSPAHSA